MKEPAVIDDGRSVINERKARTVNASIVGDAQETEFAKGLTC